MGMPPPSFARRARMPPVVFGDAAGFRQLWDDSCMRARRSWMEPPGGVFGVVDCGMGGGGPPLPVRRCVGIGGVDRRIRSEDASASAAVPALPVEDWLDDVRRCVGMGGGALLGDFVGGGAGGGQVWPCARRSRRPCRTTWACSPLLSPSWRLLRGPSPWRSSRRRPSWLVAARCRRAVCGAPTLLWA